MPLSDAEFANRLTTIYPTALRHAQMLIKNNSHMNADDLTQDVCTRCWRARHSYNNGLFDAWFYQTMRRLFLDQEAAIRIMEPLLDFTLIDPLYLAKCEDLNPFKIVSEKLAMEEIFITIEQERSEAVMRDIFEYGFTYAECADRCGMTISATKSIVHRLRAHLAISLDN